MVNKSLEKAREQLKKSFWKENPSPRGFFQCRICRRIKEGDYDICIKAGFPKCCGQIMIFDEY